MRLIIICMALSVLSLNGCSRTPLGIISSGSHLPYSDEQERIQQEQYTRRYAVWGTPPAATDAAIEYFQQPGHDRIEMVEPARLSKILDQQQIQLTHTIDDEAQILKVGKLIGADRVLFVDVSERREQVRGSDGSYGAYSIRTFSYILYYPSVAVRAVDIESSEVRWSGQAMLNKPLMDSFDPMMLSILTRAALGHATCFIERGYEWIEERANGLGSTWGCHKKE